MREIPDMKIGDRVIYTYSHHMHNRHLKKQVGKVGVITSSYQDGRYMVQFFQDVMKPTFVIKEKYLELCRDISSWMPLPSPPTTEGDE